MQQQPDYREIPTSQIPAMRMANLGFKPLMPEEVMLERKGKLANVLLEDILLSQLRKLNSFTHKGVRRDFSEENLRNAAVFLFSKRFSYDYEIRMARFRGTDKNYFIDNQQAHGNFFELLDAGMSFFFKHLSLSGEIKGFKREEHLDVPATALREALINALCHRDYDIYQCSIGIAIYDDRIEIESPGLLPRELTPKTIKRSHKSYPRNEIVATVLYQITYLEKWGSGIKRIMDACKAEGSPQPFWSEEGGYTVVTFPMNKLNGRIVTPNEPQNEPQNALQSALQKRLKAVAAMILANGSIAISVIAQNLNVSRDSIKRDLKKLGYAWEGASKNGHWVKKTPMSTSW